jgi:hypothetical protein
VVKRAATALIGRKYHFHLSALALAAALAVIVFGPGSGSRAADSAPRPMPPAPPLAVTAVTRGTGVEVAWQASQPGTQPVAGYVISKSLNGQPFTELATTAGLHFTDPAGRMGDSYRVTAFAGPAPPLRSAPSDLAVAAFPAASAEPDLALSPGDLKAIEKEKDHDKLAAITEDVLTAPDSVIGTLLGQFSQSKEALISRLDQLTPAERAKAARDCTRQENTLETMMSSVGESLQLNLIEALARCQLLK